jgi:hypothetical protein
MPSALIETATGWELPVHGWKVTRCFLDTAAFGFLVDGGTGDILRLYLEGEFTFNRADGAATFGTRDQVPIDYAPLLGLMGVTVNGVEISTNGDLRIEFASGDEIQVAPDPNYEAWELEGLGRLMVVCTPGGGEPSIFND